jgi:chorismate mutase/prephenate dehydratase
MEDIAKLRKRIDRVDEQILYSLSDRAKICRSIGLLKKKQGLSVKDQQRETNLYEKIKKRAVELNLDRMRVEEIYRQIVEMCISVQ